jgi:hypothetical protein
MPRGGFFWLALTFGEDAGWAKNLTAAGEGDIRYRGVNYHLVEPTLLDGREVTSQLPPVVRIGMPLIGVHKVLRMRAIRK